jgi:hypothetical protein
MGGGSERTHPSDSTQVSNDGRTDFGPVLLRRRALQAGKRTERNIVTPKPPGIAGNTDRVLSAGTQQKNQRQ